MVIKHASVLTDSFQFQDLDVRIKDGRIVEVGLGLTDSEEVNAEGKMLLPGLVDIHTHGCVNYDACDENPDGLRKMAEFYGSQGVTSFLYTTMSFNEKKLSDIAACISDVIEEGTKGAYAHGIYLEGPFFSPSKKGAQDDKYFVDPSVEMFKRIQEAAKGTIKVVAFAPERNGSVAFVDSLKNDCALSVAHTSANYDEALYAFERGAKSVTHLYNGMNVFSHREPGVVGAAFDHAQFVELICDGIHSHPSAVRMAFRNLGADRVVLISDSMRAAGMPDGEYTLGGQDVTVKNGRATLADGTIAGSASRLLDCVCSAVKFGIPLESAVRAASINPARLIGADKETGSIKEGKAADLLLVDSELKVESVWVKGVPVL